MDGGTANILWTLLAGVVTLAIFSFLYRDNAAYKMAEHISVGVSVGFLVVTYYYNVFKPKLWDNVLYNGQIDYLLPLFLGLILFTRFIPKIGWLSRWSIAFYIGGFSGVSIPQTLEGRVLQQSAAAVEPIVRLEPTGSTIGNLLSSLDATFIAAGTLACLVFFFFSVEQKGAIGRFAYFGRLCIMAGFGASFGYTVMARVSLLIGRIQFLTRDFTDAIGGIF
ncbi:MAG: hypothetical protein GF346_08930 [Candidatus Eisenbacteria bacterium]|nr:hypothetical protein [Candidatus Latescibacterota bacterium]MBD3302557.1 hypothetical protein [Candidatus Eisenbacteria bacterium]